MAIYNPRTHRANGCYKVNGVSFQDWDGYHNRSTRMRLKKLDREELDNYYEPEYTDNVPGAFGEGRRRTRQEKRRVNSKDRQLRWLYRFRMKYPDSRLWSNG